MSPSPPSLFPLFAHLFENREWSALGACLYVNSTWRACVQKTISDYNAPPLSRLFICYCGGNYDIAPNIKIILLNHIRNIMNNPYIPDNVDFHNLSIVVPNFGNEGLVPDPKHLDYMYSVVKDFNEKWGTDAQNNNIMLHIYGPVKVIQAYYEWIGRYTVEQGTTSLGTDNPQNLTSHITFITLWYGLLT